MKNIIFLLISTSIIMFSACSEYEIIDSKPGESLDPVTNLNYSIAGTEAILTWNLPSSYPDDIIQPVSVFIRITRNGTSAGTVTLDEAPTSFTYSYDSESTYKFIVKVMGDVDTDDKNFSNLRYSPGATIEF